VKDSGEFRRFEDDLISDARWQDKEAVLREIEAPILLAPIEETLAAFREALEAKFKLVNERIARGENKYIKLKAAGEKRCWSLIYPIEEEPINSSFYSQLPGIGSPICYGSSQQKQDSYALSRMCSTVTSSNRPIRVKSLLASSLWAPTWAYGRWLKFRGLAMIRC
jgi:hypothetical protein